MINEQTQCGYVALIGRPNVGKSTLLNNLIGEKISITSRKPQTTRHSLLGINTTDTAQIIYVDTPGIHKKQHRALNRYMNRAALSTLSDVDVLVFMIDAHHWDDEDELVYDKLKTITTPIVLAINKIDKLKDKNALLSLISFLQEKQIFKEIVPISAKLGDNLQKLQQILIKFLPEASFLFDADQLTDKSVRFLMAEFIREKAFRETGEELPYSLTVDIEKFELKKGVYHIAGLIYVEREGQKKIIIGNKGEKLKTIGTKARVDMERLLGKKVFLQLWVKVKRGWSDDDRVLRNLGYDE